MKNITSTLNGLASSLLLNVGLAAVAQKLDPVSRTKPQTMTHAISAEICGMACHFSQDKGL